MDEQDELPVESRDTIAEDDPPRSTGHATLGERYVLGAEIGHGGMGEVMSARDTQFERDVAVKRMRGHDADTRTAARFLREAMIQGRLQHPAVVPVHEIGRDSDGQPFFVMKKITGTPLTALMGHAPLKRLLRAFADVCLAIEFAHVRGIVHRDLKPDNIMLGDFGEAYVLDWGVAKIIGEDDGDFSDIVGSGEFATRADVVIGTPGYMAPEQVRNDADIDRRADVYTLGALLFEILTGEQMHPRGIAGLEAALSSRESRPILRAPTRDIPPELDALCARATAHDRERRIQTARELSESVERYLDGDRDLELRRDLARAHLERARAAFASGDDAEHRRTTMREAAGALALDPKLGGAAELVGRLMLEPPREIPDEVRQAMADDDERDVRTIGKAGNMAVLVTLALIPGLWWIAPPDFKLIYAMLASVLVNGMIGLQLRFAKRPWPGSVLLGNTVLVAILACMYSPLLIAPGIAGLLAVAMVLTPRYSFLGSPVTTGILMCLSTFVPLLLELVGVLPRTMSVSTSGILFSTPGIAGDREALTIGIQAVYSLALIIGATSIGHHMRQRALIAARHAHLQAWQLGQLVPR